MEITPFTVDVPQSELDDLFARLERHALAVRCRVRLEPRRPDAYARTLADCWATTTTGAAGRPASTPSRSSSPTSTDSRSTSSTSVHRRRCDAPLMLHGYPSSFVEFDADDRSAGRSGGVRRTGGGCLPRRRAVSAGLRLLDARSQAGLGYPPSPRRVRPIMQALGYERYGVTAATSAPDRRELCIQGGERVIGSLVVTDPARSRPSTRRRPTT